MSDFDNIIDLCSRDNQQKDWTITFTEKSPIVVLTNEDLVADSILFTESVLSGQEIKFGQLERSQFEFKFFNSGNVLYEKGDVFTVTVSIESYVVMIGDFIIDTSIPDSNGIINVRAYSASRISSLEIGSRFSESIETSMSSWQKMTTHCRLGYLMYSVLGELGIQYSPTGFNSGNYLDFLETDVHIDKDVEIIEDGVSNKYKLRFHIKEINFNVQFEFSNNFFLFYYMKNQLSSKKLDYYISTMDDYIWSGYSVSGDNYTQFNVSKAVILDGTYGTAMQRVFTYDRVELFSVSQDELTVVKIDEFNIYEEIKLYYTDSETEPIPAIIPNGGWDFTVINDGDAETYYRKLTDCTYGDILSAIYELNGICLKQGRNGIIETFNFKENDLYPSTTLYPSTSLYPRGALLLYDLKKQYLNGLEYTKNSRSYFYRLISPFLNRELADGSNYELNVNYDGYINYDISSNLLLKTFKFDQAQFPALPYLNILVSQMTNIKLDTFSLKAIGLPNVPVGSRIEIQTPSGEIVQSIIMQRQLKGIQHLEDTIKNNINGGI